MADTSVGYDRSVKVPLYARVGIQVFWLVDLEREQVDVMQEPTPEGYRTVQTYRRGERLQLKNIGQLDISVDAVLG